MKHWKAALVGTFCDAVLKQTAWTVIAMCGCVLFSAAIMERPQQYQMYCHECGWSCMSSKLHYGANSKGISIAKGASCSVAQSNIVTASNSSWGGVLCCCFGDQHLQACMRQLMFCFNEVCARSCTRCPRENSSSLFMLVAFVGLGHKVCSCVLLSCTHRWGRHTAP